MRPRLAFVVATLCCGCSFVESFDGYTSDAAAADAPDDQAATIDVPTVDTTPPPRDTTSAQDTIASDTNIDDTPVVDAPVDTAPPPCAFTTCGGACVDTDSDPMNCGGCGDVVDGSQYCVGGAPTCRANTGACTPWTYDGVHWVPCDFKCTDHLGDGSHCVDPSDPTTVRRCYYSTSDGWCIGGVCQTYSCPSNRTECPSTLASVHSCFDTRRDSNHCGACDKQCAPSETCAASGCHRYRVVASCGACGGGEKCCTAQSGWAHPTFCIEGSACPDD